MNCFVSTIHRLVPDKAVKIFNKKVKRNDWIESILHYHVSIFFFSLVILQIQTQIAALTCIVNIVKWEVRAELGCVGWQLITSPHTTTYNLEPKLNRRIKQNKYFSSNCNVLKIHSSGLCLVFAWLEYSQLWWPLLSVVCLKCNIIKYLHQNEYIGSKSWEQKQQRSNEIIEF